MAALRLVFMGTPDFSVPALAALIEAGHDVVCVYTQPPRKSGRGHKTQPSPVQAFADTKGIPVRHPTTLKDEEVQRGFAALDADAAVVAAYGLILPGAVLDAPRLGCLNIHASLLPRWRGAAPIQRAIAAGDPETGVTIMQMDEGLDTGAMLVREAVPIGPTTTASDLHDSLAALGARLIVTALEGLQDESIAATPQPDDGVTYAHKLSRDEGRLDWTRPAAELERLVRALTPWPGVWFDHDGERVRVLAAHVVDVPRSAAPGTVLDDGLTIACGEGALRPSRLQRPGRAAMETEALLRGHPIPKDAVLPAAPAGTS